jgi:hypothetical protein
LHESARIPVLPVRRCREGWAFPLAVRSKQPGLVYQSECERPNRGAFDTAEKLVRG